MADEDDIDSYWEGLRPRREPSPDISEKKRKALIAGRQLGKSIGFSALDMVQALPMSRPVGPLVRFEGQIHQGLTQEGVDALIERGGTLVPARGLTQDEINSTEEFNPIAAVSSQYSPEEFDGLFRDYVDPGRGQPIPTFEELSLAERHSILSRPLREMSQDELAENALRIHREVELRRARGLAPIPLAVEGFAIQPHETLEEFANRAYIAYEVDPDEDADEARTRAWEDAGVLRGPDSQTAIEVGRAIHQRIEASTRRALRNFVGQVSDRNQIDTIISRIVLQEIDRLVRGQGGQGFDPRVIRSFEEMADQIDIVENLRSLVSREQDPIIPLEEAIPRLPEANDLGSLIRSNVRTRSTEELVGGVLGIVIQLRRMTNERLMSGLPVVGPLDPHLAAIERAIRYGISIPDLVVNYLEAIHHAYTNNRRLPPSMDILIHEAIGRVIRSIPPQEDENPLEDSIPEEEYYRSERLNNLVRAFEDLGITCGVYQIRSIVQMNFQDIGSGITNWGARQDPSGLLRIFIRPPER